MSLWYAAHILMYVRRKQKTRANVPVWENVVLVKADSEAEALAKAQARGEKDAGDDDGTFRWDGAPAEWIFAGVRKLTLCDDPEERPRDGTEVSYLEMEVDSEKAILGLLAGQTATVKLIESVDAASQLATVSARNGNGKMKP